MKKAPTKTRTKTSPKIVEDGGKKAGGLLTSMATKTKGKKSKKAKSSNPEAVLSGQLATAIEQLAADLQAEKELKGSIKKGRALLLNAADEERRNACQRHRRPYTTIKLISGNDPAVALSVTTKNAYSKLDASDRDEAIEAISEALEIDEDEAGEIFDERFVTKTRVEIDSESLQDDDTIAFLEELIGENPRLAAILSVQQEHYPTTAFHEAQVLVDEERKIADALKDVKLLRPHSPSFKVASAS